MSELTSNGYMNNKDKFRRFKKIIRTLNAGKNIEGIDLSVATIEFRYIKNETRRRLNGYLKKIGEPIIKMSSLKSFVFSVFGNWEDCWYFVLFDKDIDPFKEKIRQKKENSFLKSRNRKRNKKLSLNSKLSMNNGYIYIIINDVWKEWVKIGKTLDPEKRLISYQTCDPFRSFQIFEKLFVKDLSISESSIHLYLENLGYERKGEWFKIEPSKAFKILNFFAYGNKSS